MSNFQLSVLLGLFPSKGKQHVQSQSGNTSSSSSQGHEDEKKDVNASSPSFGEDKTKTSSKRSREDDEDSKRQVQARKSLFSGFWRKNNPCPNNETPQAEGGLVSTGATGSTTGSHSSIIPERNLGYDLAWKLRERKGAKTNASGQAELPRQGSKNHGVNGFTNVTEAQTSSLSFPPDDAVESVLASNPNDAMPYKAQEKARMHLDMAKETLEVPPEQEGMSQLGSPAKPSSGSRNGLPRAKHMAHDPEDGGLLGTPSIVRTHVSTFMNRHDMEEVPPFHKKPGEEARIHKAIQHVERATSGSANRRETAQPVCKKADRQFGEVQAEAPTASPTTNGKGKNEDPESKTPETMPPLSQPQGSVSLSVNTRHCTVLSPMNDTENHGMSTITEGIDEESQEQKADKELAQKPKANEEQTREEQYARQGANNAGQRPEPNGTVAQQNDSVAQMNTKNNEKAQQQAEDAKQKTSDTHPMHFSDKRGQQQELNIVEMKAQTKERAAKLFYDMPLVGWCNDLYSQSNPDVHTARIQFIPYEPSTDYFGPRGVKSYDFDSSWQCPVCQGLILPCNDLTNLAKAMRKHGGIVTLPHLDWTEPMDLKSLTPHIIGGPKLKAARVTQIQQSVRKSITNHFMQYHPVEPIWAVMAKPNKQDDEWSDAMIVDSSADLSSEVATASGFIRHFLGKQDFYALPSDAGIRDKHTVLLWLIKSCAVVTSRMRWDSENYKRSKSINGAPRKLAKSKQTVDDFDSYEARPTKKAKVATDAENKEKIKKTRNRKQFDNNNIDYRSLCRLGHAFMEDLSSGYYRTFQHPQYGREIQQMLETIPMPRLKNLLLISFCPCDLEFLTEQTPFIHTDYRPTLPLDDARIERLPAAIFDGKIDTEHLQTPPKRRKNNDFWAIEKAAIAPGGEFFPIDTSAPSTKCSWPEEPAATSTTAAATVQGASIIGPAIMKGSAGESVCGASRTSWQSWHSAKEKIPPKKASRKKPAPHASDSSVKSNSGGSVPGCARAPGASASGGSVVGARNASEAGSGSVLVGDRNKKPAARKTPPKNPKKKAPPKKKAVPKAPSLSSSNVARMPSSSSNDSGYSTRSSARNKKKEQDQEARSRAAQQE